MAPFWFILPLLLSCQVKAGSEAGSFWKNLRNGSHPEYPAETSFHNEADMMLTSEQEAILHGKRAAGDLTTLWEDVDGFPLIPFTFTDHEVDRTPVQLAIHVWQANTCIHFLEVQTDYVGPHLRFQRNGDACMSNVGRSSSTGQDVYISEACEMSHGMLLRILGHAIGIWNEEMRSDRDSYIRILTDNVLEDSLEFFLINADDTHGIPYDYCSIMHSHERIYTGNGEGTIATLDPLYKSSIGQSQKLSHLDMLQANMMYQCSDKRLSACSLASDPCVNHGFLNRSCICVCPGGTSGDFCETITSTNHGNCLMPLSEIITEPTTIVSPSVYGSLREDPTEIRFSKFIQAPDNHVIVLTFDEFDIYPRTQHYVSEGVAVDMCWYDSLELCLDNLYNGEWYCGTELQGLNMTSVGNSVSLHFLSRLNFMSGFSVTVNFVEMMTPPEEQCTLYIFHGEDETTFTAMHWYTPNHPDNYMDDSQCLLGPGSETAVGRTLMTVQEFDLADGDQLIIENSYTEPTVYEGLLPGDLIEIPTLYFTATFNSDSAVTGTGFWLTFESEVPGCYRNLIAMSEEAVIKSPRYPDSPPPPGKQCEYRIMTQDPAMRVLVTLSVFSVRDPSFIAINLAGDALYNSTNVIKLQKPVDAVEYFSFGNVVRLFFQGSKNVGGYKIRYRQIAM